MPRNPNKRRPGAPWRVLAAAGLLGLALSEGAFAQNATPPVASRPPAAAVAPGAITAADDQARARIWAATARFVYADDPMLANVRPQLGQTVRETSVKAFARGLEAAAQTERQQLPNQTHVLKFLSIFKRVQADEPADAEALIQMIRSELEANKERMASPARAKSFAALLAQLRQIAAAVPAVNTGPAAAGSTLAAGTVAGTITESAAEDALTQAAEADLTAAPPAGAAAGPALTPPAPAPAAPSSTLPMLALILSALSLLGVLYLLLTRGRSVPAPLAAPESEPNPAPRKSGEPRFSQGQYEEMRKVVRAELAAAQAQTQSSRPPQQQQRANGPVNQPKAAPQPTTSSTALAPVAAPAAAVPLPPPSIAELTADAPVVPPAPRLRTIYVNQQPLDGAFRRDNLADAPASYTIFEISVDEQQDPNSGTFVVTRNEGAHGGYIGSHHSILDPACTYSYPQGAVSRIITDAPGTVQKTPAGDWQIGQKARIHFA